MSDHETLILTRSDVENLVRMDDAIETMEEAFRAQGLGQARNLTQNFALDSGTVSIKAGFLPGIARVGLKSLGLVVLCQAGQLRRPLAILEQAPITYLRTGAAGALAAKYLARRDCRTVGVVGTGRQARAQVDALSRLFRLSRVRAWSPTPAHREQYAGEMSVALGVPVGPAAGPKEAVEGQDLVITATRATGPVIEGGWVSPGTHVNAIGADMPGSQELPGDLLKSAEVYADEIEQALWTGAVNVPVAQGLFRREDFRGNLGQVISGKVPGRSGPTAITVFDCSGLGMMDVALAQRVYERALSSPNFRRVDWFA